MGLPRSTTDLALRQAFLLYPGPGGRLWQSLPHLLRVHGFAATLAALSPSQNENVGEGDQTNREEDKNLTRFLWGLEKLGVKQADLSPSNTHSYLVASETARVLADAFKRCDTHKDDDEEDALIAHKKVKRPLCEPEPETVNFVTSLPTRPPKWDNVRFALNFGFENNDLKSDGKADFFDRVTRITQSPRYERAFLRQQHHLSKKSLCHSETLYFSRLMIGLSNPSVFETSITLMQPYGVPFIPGSACKGLALARGIYANKHGHQFTLEGTIEKWMEKIFGSATNEGRVRCLDAWWVPSSALENRLFGLHTTMPLVREQTTPHHKDFRDAHAKPISNEEDLMKRKKVFPTPFDSPVPIAQLAAQGKFLFAMEATKPGDHFALEIAFALLKWGLEEEGIGAKAHSHGRILVEPS